MNRPLWINSTLVAIVGAALLPTGVAAAATDTARARCVPTRPGTGFYEAGRKASEPITASGCTTVSVSHIRDVRAPDDRCQTFLLALLSTDGSDPTYTEPVRACSVPAARRTLLATDIPDGTVFRVLYDVDYIEPTQQVVEYAIWR